MVQGLGFLSKKSWHTKNLNNQEKVWIAEQQQEQERIRTTELAKQIQIEREQNEINDITGGNTNAKKKIYDRGIDWMYTGQTKDSEIAKEDAQKIAEEYLLGKPIAFHGASGALPVTAATAATATITTVEGNRTIDAVVMNDAAAATTATATSEHIRDDNDILSFKKNHKYEDPMYAVSLQTVRKEKMIEQQKELYQKVGIATETSRQDDDRKDDNNVDTLKQFKAQKKSKKKKSKKYDSDHSSDDNDERHRKHSKRHSRDHKERSRAHGKRKRYSDDEQSYDSRGSGYSNDRNRRRGRNNYSDRRANNDYDRMHQNREYDRDDNRPHPPSHRDDDLKQPPPTAGSRYGLVTKNTATSDHHYNRRDTRTNDLGPDMELIQRKREEKYSNNAYNARSRGYNNHSHNNNSHRGTVDHSRHRHQQHQYRISNPEERAKALRAMEENAKSFDTTRRQAKQNDNTLDHTAKDASGSSGATFLHEISQKVHGVYDIK